MRNSGGWAGYALGVLLLVAVPALVFASRVAELVAGALQ